MMALSSVNNELLIFVETENNAAHRQAILYCSVAMLGFGSYAPKPEIFGHSGGGRRPALFGRDDGAAHSKVSRKEHMENIVRHATSMMSHHSEDEAATEAKIEDIIAIVWHLHSETQLHNPIAAYFLEMCRFSLLNQILN